MSHPAGLNPSVEASTLSAPSTHAERAYACVRELPEGKVTTYGAIGRLLGLSPRYVGGAMAHAPEDLPWWRVVGAEGRILTHRKMDGTGHEQSQRLAAEGVAMDTLGRVRLDLAETEP